MAENVMVMGHGIHYRKGNESVRGRQDAVEAAGSGEKCFPPVRPEETVNGLARPAEQGVETVDLRNLLKPAESGRGDHLLQTVIEEREVKEGDP